MGLTTLFNIGRSALTMNQQALSVTSHNVANVSTPGYSRQDAELATAVPELQGGSWFGRGVNVETVQRNFDSFVNGQQNTESTNFGYSEQRSAILREVEDIFNETETGLSDRMQEFFNAWNDVAANPEGGVQRVALLQTTDNFISQLESMSTRLLDIRNTYNRAVPQMVNDVNTLIREVYDLNRQVVATGGSPDILDLRDRKIMELSEYVPINRFEDEMGRVTVIVANRTVVEPSGYSELAALQTGSEGMYDVVFDADGTSLNLSDSLGGSLKGVLQVRDGDIVNYLNQLDTLAYHVAVQVNTLHQSGYGLDGSTGRNYFGDTGGMDLFNPPLNASANVSGAARRLSALITEPNQIAASSTLSELPGNNVQARSIGNLQGQALISGFTFTNYYSALVSEVGRDRQDSIRGEESSKSILFQLEERRQEISGVNLDEEAVNVIRFQRSYEASAQIIRTTSELFQVLVELAR